jgi:tetratricopeptide (TPR) repeat protein
MPRLLHAALAGLALIAPLGAGAHAATGTPVDNVELTTLSGGKEKVLSAKARANVLVFFRTGQERSRDALVQLAACEKLFAGKPVRWVGVVSADEEREAVKALVSSTGVAMPVVLDEGDELYGRLGIRLHPMVALVDGAFRVASIEMYRQIDYCEIIKARLRFMLGEIDAAAVQAVLEPPKGTMPGADPRDVARRDVNLGRRLLQRGAPQKALQSAEKALARAELPQAWVLKGDALAALGDCAAARTAYARALALDPKDEAALAGPEACAGR